MIVCRAASPADQPEIEAVIEAAFAPEDIRAFYLSLKSEGTIAAEFVAEMDGRIIGHISFVAGHLETLDAALPCLQLTPLSVHPDFQNQGIGTRLTELAHQELTTLGHQRFIVLGHPDYYPRFGYSAQLAEGIECPWQGKSAFMAKGDIPETANLQITNTIFSA